MKNSNILINYKVIAPILFLVLFFFNFKYLFNPPYWDAIFGAFHQAVWLVKNNFDYFKLYSEPGYGELGPNIYYFNLVPLLYGILLYFLDHRLVFFILHVLNILSITFIIIIFYNISKKYHDSLTSILLSLAIFTHPIITGQIKSLNMELYLTVFILLSLFYFLNHNYLKASLMCIVAYFLKSSAIILALSYFLLFFIQIFISRKKIKNKIVLCFPLFLITIFEFLDPSPITYKYNSLSSIWHVIQFHYTFIFPFIIIVLCLIVFLSILQIFIKNFDFFSSHLILYLFVFGFWMSYFMFYWPLPRYIIYIISPTFLLFSLLLKPYFRIFHIIFVLIVFANIFNQNGNLLHPFPNHVSRHGSFLERSNEYLKDLEQNQKLAWFLESNDFDRPLKLTKFFYLAFSDQRFGYVNKNISHRILLNYNNPFKFDPINPIFVYVPDLIMPPSKAIIKTILYLDNSLNGYPLIVFQSK